MLGIIVSPFTGQKVLGFKQISREQVVIRDNGKKLSRTKLSGDVGDRFNYVTLENYGKGEVYPVPIRNRQKKENGKRRS